MPHIYNSNSNNNANTYNEDHSSYKCTRQAKIHKNGLDLFHGGDYELLPLLLLLLQTRVDSSLSDMVINKLLILPPPQQLDTMDMLWFLSYTCCFLLPRFVICNWLGNALGHQLIILK